MLGSAVMFSPNSSWAKAERMMLASLTSISAAYQARASEPEPVAVEVSVMVVVEEV